MVYPITLSKKLQVGRIIITNQYPSLAYSIHVYSPLASALDSANRGAKQFSLIFAHPELRDKPAHISGQREETSKASIQVALQR